MPAARGPLYVEAGSYEPWYWDVADRVTGLPLDLTQPGITLAGRVATRSDGKGTVLLDLPDNSDAWDRTSEGRIYFHPHSVDSAAWTFREGYYQFELTHPSGEDVRFGMGPFYVDPELVTP